MQVKYSKYSCCVKLKNEFQIRKFGLENQRPDLFVTSKYRVCYLVWTVLSILYHLTWLLVDIFYYNLDTFDRYFIYLTNWGYTILTIFSIYNCIVVTYVHIRRKDIITGTTKQMTWYLKVLWVMSNLMNSSAVGITVLYYAFLTPNWIPPSVEKHAINSVFIILNILITAMPINLLHFYQPIIFGLIYMVFSLTYQIGGVHQAIYPVLDWTNQLPMAILLVTVVVFFILPLFHVLCFSLYNIRMLICDFFCSKTRRDSIIEDMELGE